MKLKEIEKTANVAWSPAEHYPIYIAAGTASQQLDATFSTTASLEIYKFNPEEPSTRCPLISSTDVNHRFSKVVWGNVGIGDSTHPSGMVVGGTDNGEVRIWDAFKLMSKDSNSLVHTLAKHVGSVGALDFNTFQENLLASGAGDSEILLWDLNNPSTPMTPGAKSQPADDVSCLAWNCQLSHILASALNSRLVVWDLRKSEPIIKISDSMSRIKSKMVAWHPQVATQLVLSSEDDSTPVVQLWDLRFAASPVKVLERHQKGILSMSWCRKDPDLLITCGKDNRLLCWNPNTDVVHGEVVYELPMGNQWCFDVQWCPRNPLCVSASSFDGHIAVYSLMGGEITREPLAPSNKIADSFGGFDSVSSVSHAHKVETYKVQQLAKAPRWLKRPCGASFAFGGKLVTFSSVKAKDTGQIENHLTIQQVLTEPTLVAKSNQLEHALSNHQYTEFCSLKIANNADTKDEIMWKFIKVNFESNPREKFLAALGFETENISKKVLAITDGDVASTNESAVASGVYAQSPGLKSADQQFITDDDHPGLQNGAQSGVPDFDMSFTDDADGLLTQTLLTGDFEKAVKLCLHAGRMADAIILANADGPDLLRRTMKTYFAQANGPVVKLISMVVQKEYGQIVRSSRLEDWKEALAVVLTYAKPEEFATYCDILGARLEQEEDESLSANAILCYICSGNLSKFLECWLKQNPNASNPLTLQDLVEKVMLLRKAIETVQGREVISPIGNLLADKLSEYATVLASQGNLSTALAYMAGATETETITVLRHRLQMALGHTTTHTPWPKQEVKTSVSLGRQASNQPVHALSQTTHQPVHALSVNTTLSPAPQPVVAGGSAYPSHPTANGSAYAASDAAGSYYSQQQQLQHQPQQQPYQQALQQQYQQPQYQSPHTQQYQPTQQHQKQQQPQHHQPTQQQPQQYQTAQHQPQLQLQHQQQSQSQPTNRVGYQQPAYQPAAPLTNVSQPAYQTPQPSAYPTQTYTAQPGYASYGQQPQSAGHVFSKGLLGKKYSTQPPAAAQPSQSNLPAQALFSTTGQSLGITPGNQGVNRQPDLYNPVASTVPMAAPHAGSQYQVHGQSYSQSLPEVDAVSLAPAGWNDPPPVHAKNPQNESHKALPITQPVYNPNAATHTDPGVPPQGQLYTGQQYPVQQAGVSQYSPSQQYGIEQQKLSPPASLSPNAQEVVREIPKGPIPSKHQVLKDVFDALANKCLQATTNPQQKRKLEDVLKKLECLYDKLRSSALDDSTMNGLHQIAQAVKQYNYQSGLDTHSALVMKGNFSEISAFMPGIKMLMQTAYQLQVFV